MHSPSKLLVSLGCRCQLLVLLVGPSCGGCWYKAKCEMRDFATQDRRRNECAKWWIFHEIAKWRRWRHAPRLMATAVIMNSRHRFSKRAIGIPQISRVPSTFTSVYVCAIATVVPRLTAAAVAMHPHRRILKRLHVADVKNLIGDDQITLTVDRNSAI